MSTQTIGIPHDWEYLDEESRYQWMRRNGVVTPENWEAMIDEGLTFSDMLNGRYGEDKEALVRDLYRQWNERLGIVEFGLNWYFYSDGSDITHQQVVDTRAQYAAKHAMDTCYTAEQRYACIAECFKILHQRGELDSSLVRSVILGCTMGAVDPQQSARPQNDDEECNPQQTEPNNPNDRPTNEVHMSYEDWADAYKPEHNGFVAIAFQGSMFAPSGHELAHVMQEYVTGNNNVWSMILNETDTHSELLICEGMTDPDEAVGYFLTEVPAPHNEVIIVHVTIDGIGY